LPRVVMELGIKLLFWITAFIIGYVYLGYPVLLRFLVALRQRDNRYVKPQVDRVAYPAVSLLVAIHNEAKVIPAKLLNLSQLKYPGEIEIVFVLDGCTDHSAEIIRAYDTSISSYDFWIVEIPNQLGKEAALRRAISSVRGDVLVFSDADSMYVPNVVTSLVRHLIFPEVAAVSGREVRMANGNNDEGIGEGLYCRYDNFIKALEGQLGSQVMVNGGVFAIWKKFYPLEIRDGLTQDAVIPLQLALEHRKIAYANNAVSTETYNLSPHEDFKRRIRTVSRAFASIVAYRAALNPFRTGLFALKLLSHRVLRWFLIPMLTSLFVLNLALFYEHIFYRIFFLGEVIFILAAMIGWASNLAHRRIRLLYFPYYFIYIHIAAFIAVFRVLMGFRMSKWIPSSRSTG